MINLDQIKNDWNNLLIINEDLERRNRELTRRLVNERVKNHQQKLAKSYRIGYIGFAFPFLAFALHSAIDASVTLCVFYALFGLVIGIYDIWFMYFIKSTDYLAMSTVKAISHTSKIVRYQNYATILSVIATIGILCLLFYEINLLGDPNITYGGITGLIVGSAIGIKKCIENHLNARRMLRELKQLDDTENDKTVA